VLGQLDVILDLLVRDDAPDEEEVEEAIVEQAFERGQARRVADAAGIDGDREDAGGAETKRVQLVLIVGRVGAKNAAGVTLWYCSTRPRGSSRNACVIGDGSAK
jgi:hypothetical protein